MPKKSFTVGYMSSSNFSDNSRPFIKFGGKWLKKEFGIDVGDRLELVKGNNMIVLIKIPKMIVHQQKVQYEISKLENQLNILKEEL